MADGLICEEMVEMVVVMMNWEQREKSESRRVSVVVVCQEDRGSSRPWQPLHVLLY